MTDNISVNKSGRSKRMMPVKAPGSPNSCAACMMKMERYNPVSG